MTALSKLRIQLYEAKAEVEQMHDMMALADSAIGTDGKRIAELEAEIERLQDEHMKELGTRIAAEERIAELERHIRSTDGSSVRIAELEKENEKLKAYDPYTVDEIFRLKAELAKHQEAEFHPDWSMLKATRVSLRESWDKLKAARERIALHEAREKGCPVCMNRPIPAQKKP